MVGIRVLLILGCVAAVAIAAALAPWEARLVCGNHSWIVDLGTHPIWDPPTAPDHDGFRRHFGDTNGFPPANGGCLIHSEYDPFSVGMLAILLSCPCFLFCGTLHRYLHRTHQDILLHCSLWIGLWTPIGLLCFCCLAWAGSIVGFVFLSMGSCCGLLLGLSTFQPGKAY